MVNTNGQLSNGKQAWWLSAGIQVPFIFSFLTFVLVLVLKIGAYQEEFQARGVRQDKMEGEIEQLDREYNVLALENAQLQQKVDQLERSLDRLETIVQRHIDNGGPK